MTKIKTLQESRQFAGVVCQSAVPLIAEETLNTSQAC